MGTRCAKARGGGDDEGLMDFDTFESLAGEMWEAIPEMFREGVQALVIHAADKADPINPGVFLMGECSVDAATSMVPDVPLQTNIDIYHGSFTMISQRSETFDWEGELWETLTHELRHHIEWRAGIDHLGDEDDLQLENLARINGRPFAHDFHRRGSRLDEGVYTVDGDLFLEVPVPHKEWGQSTDPVTVEWAGITCEAAPPSTPGARLTYLTASTRPSSQRRGAPDAPWNPWREVVLVLRKRRRWFG